MLPQTQTSVHTERHSQRASSLLNGTSGGLAQKAVAHFFSVFNYDLQWRSSPLRVRTLLAEGPTYFPQCTLETSGPGSPSTFVPFEQLPNDCHAKQQNQHRCTVGMRYVEYMPSTLPSPQTHTHYHTHYLNPVPASFLSPLSTNFFVCYFVLQHILIPCLVCVRSACVSSSPSSLCRRAT